MPSTSALASTTLPNTPNPERSTVGGFAWDSSDIGTIVFISTPTSSANSRGGLFVQSDGAVEVGGRAADSDWFQSRVSSTTLPLREWVHVAGILDYANEAVEIYFDGVLQPLRAGSIEFSALATPATFSRSSTLGSTGGFFEYLQGALDDVRIYNERLNAAAIAELVAGPPPGRIVIEQKQITGAADYGSGFGQTLLLPPGETIDAIQLHLGSLGAGGGGLRVRLYEATGGPGSYSQRVDPEPIAEGLLDRAEIDGMGWQTIVLDKPFTNEKEHPYYLVFEGELLTLGSGGYNNYSFSNGDPYAGGHSVRWDGYAYQIRDGEDLAFRILTDLDPGLFDLAVPTIEFRRINSPPYTARVEIRLEGARAGYLHSLLASPDLSLPIEEWETLGVAEGFEDSDAAIWTDFHQVVPSRMFYRVLVTLTPDE